MLSECKHALKNTLPFVQYSKGPTFDMASSMNATVEPSCEVTVPSKERYNMLKNECLTMRLKVSHYETKSVLLLLGSDELPSCRYQCQRNLEGLSLENPRNL